MYIYLHRNIFLKYETLKNEIPKKLFQSFSQQFEEKMYSCHIGMEWIHGIHFTKKVEFFVKRATNFFLFFVMNYYSLFYNIHKYIGILPPIYKLEAVPHRIKRRHCLFEQRN